MNQSDLSRREWLKSAFAVGLTAGSTAAPLTAAADEDRPKPALRIGSRLELFVDDYLVASRKGVEQVLHAPTPREVALTFDKPWEGMASAYHTIIRDEGLYRVYYRGMDFSEGHEVTCYAESTDGIGWSKPMLGLYAFKGSKQNNIVWKHPAKLPGRTAHNFTPFRDTRPGVPNAQRYKALAGIPLYAMVSADAIHWRLLSEEPVLKDGAFDSQNVAFWDASQRAYLAYFRIFTNRVRDIALATSQDFINWSKAQPLDYGNAPVEHLYTNVIAPYFRAPHIYLGFPRRMVPTRHKYREFPIPGACDGLLMSSRDGRNWRRWQEAFLRPGPQRGTWLKYGNLIALGILVTKPLTRHTPDELSFYRNEYYREGQGPDDYTCYWRRYTLRMDGFVSMHAGADGGVFTTKPLIFTGRQLVINYATSAAGSVRVELTDAAGSPIPGFELANCSEIFGDEIEEKVEWNGNPDLSALAGKPVRARFQLKDADLYALRFKSE